MFIKRPRKMDFRLRYSFYCLLIAFILMTSCRLALCLLNPSFFDGLSSLELCRAFLWGIFLDAKAIALVLGPAVLLLNLPVNSLRYVKICFEMMLWMLLGIGIFSLFDLFYFNIWHVHLSWAAVNLSWFAWMDLVRVLMVALVGVLLSGVISTFTHKLFQNYLFIPLTPKGEIAKFLGCILFVLWSICGSWARPAYEPAVPSVLLAQNGIFTAYQTRHVIAPVRSEDLQEEEVELEGEKLIGIPSFLTGGEDFEVEEEE